MRKEELAQGTSVAVLRAFSPDAAVVRPEQPPALQKLESVAVKLSELVELIRGMADSSGQPAQAQSPAPAVPSAKTASYAPVVAVASREASAASVVNVSEEATFGALMDKLLAPPLPLAVSRRAPAPGAGQPEAAIPRKDEIRPKVAPLPSFSTRGHSEAPAAMTLDASPVVEAQGKEVVLPEAKASPAQADAKDGAFFAALAAIQDGADTRRGAANSNANKSAPSRRPVVGVSAEAAEAAAPAVVVAEVCATKPREVPPEAIEAAKNLEKLLAQLSARKAAAAGSAGRPTPPTPQRVTIRAATGEMEQAGEAASAKESGPIVKEVVAAATADEAYPVTAVAASLSEAKKTKPQLSLEAQLAIDSAAGASKKIQDVKAAEAVQGDVGKETTSATAKLDRQEDRAAFMASMRKLVQEPVSAPKVAAPSIEIDAQALAPQAQAPQANDAPKPAQRPTLGPKVVDIQSAPSTAKAAAKPSLWRDVVVAHRMKAAGFAVMVVGAGYLAAAPRMGDLRPLTDMMQDMRAKLNTIDGFASREEVATLRRGVGDIKSGLEELSSSTAMAVADINARIDRLDRAPVTGRESAVPDKGRQPARATERREPAVKSAPVAKTAAIVPVQAPAGAGLNQGFNLQTPLYLGSGTQASEVTKVAAAPTSALKRAGDNSQGYVVREIYEGSAVVENAFGRRKISVGDILPGAGKVQAIEMRDRQWVVVTTNGLIASALN